MTNTVQKKSLLKRPVLFLLILLSGVHFALGESTSASRFDAANIAYQDGNYGQAIEMLEHLIDETGHSVALHFNLGNAYLQSGKPGAAIFHYERARILSPRDPDVLANLTIAYATAEQLPPTPGWLDRLAALFSLNTWTWLTASAGWLTVGLVMVPLLFRRKHSAFWFGASLTAATLLVCSTALGVYHFQSKQGVVLQNDTPLKVAPTTSSPEVAFVQSGTVATILERNRNHYLVRLENGETGWLAPTQFSPIWPLNEITSQN